MAVSNAEKQKRYREKKKAKEGSSYYEKERQRKKKSYISTDQLNEEQKKKRRESHRRNSQTYYYSKKEKLKKTIDEETKVTRCTSKNTRLLVKLDFHTRKSQKGRTGLKTVYTKTLKRKNKLIKKLEKDKIKLCKQRNKLQKRLIRIHSQRSNLPTPEKTLEIENMTPKSKTKAQLKEAGMNPRRPTKIRKALLFANILAHNVKNRLRCVKTRKAVKHIISGKILKKYRCISQFSREASVGRKAAKNFGNTLQSRKTVGNVMRETVVTYLEREDNCTIMPGKKDVIDGKQKRILNDYLYNLHQKFLVERPDVKMSLSTFQSLRPKNVLTADFAKPNQCLCNRHQNFVLKLRAINTQIKKCQLNPEMFAKEYEEVTKIDELFTSDDHPGEVKYTEWVKVQDGEKQRTKLLDKKLGFQEFKKLFIEQFKLFKEHVFRIRTIYDQLKTLRASLSPTEVLIWMDFSENFSCTVAEQVQSAYWNPAAVTLHTAVMYYTDENQNSTHKSIVAVSNDLSHNAASVCAIIKKMMPGIMNTVPQLSKVYYLTDSPTSQYRNRSIFQMISYHQQDYGLPCSWMYLEAGHGKGPCDGLGASVKRSASRAITHGRIIQSAEEFFTWSNSFKTSIDFIYVSKEDCKAIQNILQERGQGIKRVQGTMKLHAVVGQNLPNTILVRDLPCCCPECLTSPDASDCGWTVHSFTPVPVQAQQFNHDVRNEQPSVKENLVPEINAHEGVEHEGDDGSASNSIEEIKIGDWVAAVYDRKWYIGNVLEIYGNEFHINFLEKANLKHDSNVFKYPRKQDDLWMSKNEILMVLPDNPVPSGKSGRLLELEWNTLKRINELYNS
jgi:hypothetical protein